MPRLLRPTARAYIFVGSRPEYMAAYADVLRECLLDLQDLLLASMLVWTWPNPLAPHRQRTTGRTTAVSCRCGPEGPRRSAPPRARSTSPPSSSRHRRTRPSC